MLWRLPPVIPAFAEMIYLHEVLLFYRTAMLAARKEKVP
jgi:hypothetical protein